MALEGVDECIRNLELFIKEDWPNSCKAFEEVTMGAIVPECVDECPVKYGTMRASIPAVSGVEVKGQSCIATIGAGGAASKYTRRQHEDLTFHHTVGKAKFIEDPIMRYAERIPQMVVARKEGSQ